MIEIKTMLPEHIPQVHNLVKALADFEKSLHEVTLTPEEMKTDFEAGKFKGFVALSGDAVVGIAIYYPRYSTWKGTTIHLEDFIVSPEYRKRGIGKQLFNAVAEATYNLGATRFEWEVLEWNEPAINFYKNVKANLDPEWHLAKLRREELKEYLKRIQRL